MHESNTQNPDFEKRHHMYFSQHCVRSFRFISRRVACDSLLFSTFPRKPTLDESSCIRYIQICRSLNELKQIQTQIFMAGLHQSRGTLNKLMVFCTDPSLGNLGYAEKVFDFSREPSLFIYNVMIKAFAKKGSFGRVLLLFDRLREVGLWPDNFTYPFVLKAIGCLGQVQEGRKVHGFVVKTGLEFDTFVCNSLIDMYAQLGEVVYFTELFEEMPERDSVSWNVTISAYVRCRRFADAVSVFGRMRVESNEKPDEATVVTTLTACTSMKNLELGKEIHDYVRNNLDFTVRISNALLDMYAKCGLLYVARKIFDEMPTKNVICWTSMVSGYVNYGKLDEARELFEKSPIRDVVLWTVMINGYVQYNRFDEAMILFQEMQNRRVKADKYTMVALLTGCAQLGALQEGKWIHGCIDEHGIKIDAVVGTALIEMYSKCGCIDESLAIFEGIRDKDKASWTSIICGLAMNGKTNKALELFLVMERVGIYPDDITFIGALSACSHAGLVEEGRQLFHSMTDTYEIKPKLEHYGCLIDLFGRAGLLDEAEELIEKIPNDDNDIIVPLYGALLSACRIHGNVEMGERVARRLADIESSDSSVHMLLANIYASADRWEDMTKVRRIMKDLGVKKVPGCSSIEINGIVR
ncbi:Tetratricopeptide-like helical domain containing protein [Parasponia andersonii]|uniref:Tetratricopeptide-like helical domain containing protein n=1 Tax=Parasponia andersonii TaxID=3476 RepID=A0A2P5C7D4_PARAD|nr:Tetratricopeptide-like helical domain containing protein [Parasponia andersonii]